MPATVLQDMGAKVRAYDPTGMEQAKPLLKNVVFCGDAYSCAEGASALVIVTEWDQFRALDFACLKEVMERPLLVDLRNISGPRKSRATASPMRASEGPKVRSKHNEYHSGHGMAPSDQGRRLGNPTSCPNSSSARKILCLARNRS